MLGPGKRPACFLTLMQLKPCCCRKSRFACVFSYSESNDTVSSISTLLFEHVPVFYRSRFSLVFAHRSDQYENPYPEEHGNLDIE